MHALRDGVTVVATVFNKALYLPLVVAALKGQTTDVPLEYVFVDDGSTDGSLEVLRELARGLEHVLILSQPNQGPARALNLGLSMVRTRYVKGLDADDLLPPDAVSLLLDGLAAHPECRWAYGMLGVYESFPPDTAALFAREEGQGPLFRRADDHLALSLRHPRTIPSAWLAETTLLREVGFCDETLFVQDYSLELRLAAASAACLLNRPVCHMARMRNSDRLSLQEGQTLHDVTAAQANFFAAHPEHLPRFGWSAAKKATGRAWLWGRRHCGKTVLSREFAAFAAARCRIGDPLALMRGGCRVFGNVRRPGSTRPAVRTVLAAGCFESGGLPSP